jgi:hypothetical protein
MQKKSITVLSLACLLLPVAGFAASFHINPGKWEFTTTVNMPMLPTPQTSTTTECVTREEVEKDPLAALKDIGEECRITRKTIKGSRLEFAMECNQQGMTSRGKGYFEAQGDTSSGAMEMTMQMPEGMPAGMPGMANGAMTVKTSWQARRIGTCE